jgi:hypothetical protein
MCIHLNTLALFDFIVNILNVRLYYIVYKTNIAELAYRVYLSSLLLDLILLSIIIHESRNVPAHPVIAKSVCLIIFIIERNFYRIFIFVRSNRVVQCLTKAGARFIQVSCLPGLNHL